jgi:hypothetical protein
MMTEDLEDELRSLFARSGAGIVVPEQARTRLLGRDYRPRRVSWKPPATLAAAAAAVVAVVAVALEMAAGPPHGAAGPAVRLASHTFRMPAGYHLTAATSAPCRPFAITNTIRPAGASGAGAGSTQNPAGRAAMRAAASSAGGCIVFSLSPPYTPTPSVPDPVAYSTAHPVRVGSYHGFIYRASMLVLPGAHGHLAPGWHQSTDLYVQLPAGGGRMHDLVIGATGLPAPALVKVAASGLAPGSR